MLGVEPTLSRNDRRSAVTTARAEQPALSRLPRSLRSLGRQHRPFLLLLLFPWRPSVAAGKGDTPGPLRTASRASACSTLAWPVAPARAKHLGFAALRVPPLRCRAQTWLLRRGPCLRSALPCWCLHVTRSGAL